MRPPLLAVTAFLLLAGPGVPAPAYGQAAADSAAIRATALDYIEGWYQADASRMARAVHPELVKRLHLRVAEVHRSYVQTMGSSALVTSTARGGGSDAPESERRSEVRILDIFRGAASVRVDAHDWVDYLQMVRTDDGWKILNVLWELRRPPEGPR